MWCVQSNRINQQPLELMKFLWVVPCLTAIKETLLFWIRFGEYPMIKLFLWNLFLGGLNISSKDSNSDWDFLGIEG